MKYEDLKKETKFPCPNCSKSDGVQAIKNEDDKFYQECIYCKNGEKEKLFDTPDETLESIRQYWRTDY